ncbi:MAG: HDOD domain-containing protein [Gallionella sp.]|nr:HDOD domain-containing protein [Gallionella sp.]
MHYNKHSADHYGVSDDKLVNFASSIEIPACPRVIIEMTRAQNQSSPDMRAIGNLAEKDPAMTAALLKTVNSPFFGLRAKMLSVQQAVMFLGIRNVINIVTAIALKNAGVDVQGDGVRCFWERTSVTAAFAAELANRIIGLARDEVYIHVLFRDAAIPLMIAHRVKSGQLSNSTLSDKKMYMAQVEVEQSSIDHAIISGHFTKKWLLPENTQQSVRLHLNVEMFLDGPQKKDVPKWVSLQIAMGYLAEHIMREYFGIPHPELWETTQIDAFLRYVDIDRAEFHKISMEMLDEKKGSTMANDLMSKS